MTIHATSAIFAGVVPAFTPHFEVWLLSLAIGLSGVYIAKVIVRGLRETDEVLEVGDLAMHDEEAFPTETFAERVSALSRH